MALAVTSDTRRVATYERVSSDDQALRQTIKTQTDELARSLARDPSVVLIERYADDGVSGTIPLAERPAGGRLMRDAAAARFDELHVYKFDRLGRDAVDLLVVRRRLIELGIRVISVVEAEPDLLSYDLLSVVADHARREFLRRSADGMARAAREGRYTGGIVAYGYTVLGTKGTARLLPDEREVAPGLSAADAVRLMYTRVADDGWSCERLARELNRLGVLPHYARDARQVRRGERRQRTQGIWRAGRVRNTLANPLYRGELAYGRRTTKGGR
jgi:site-specific DNA recombinase